MFALKRTSLESVLDCVAPCLESLLSLAKLRLEEVWKSFEHTKCVDVWLKNSSFVLAS